MASPSQEFTEGLLSYLTFSWFSATMALGGYKEIQVDELPLLQDDDTAEKVWSSFKPTLPTYSAGQPARPNSLFFTLFALVKKVFIAQSILQLISSAASFASPLAVEVLVRYVSETHAFDSKVPLQVALCVAALFVGPLVRTVCEGQLRHRGRRMGIRIRSALTAAIYEKALRLNISGSKQTSGQLTNLFSVDAEAVQSAAAEASMLWATPLEVLVSIGLLFRVLGVATTGGVVFLLLAIPVNFWAVRAVNAVEEQLQEDSDERLNVTTELLHCIRVVKLFAWEKKFLEKVRSARKLEMKTLRKLLWTFVVVDVMWETIPMMVGVFAFVVHTQVLGRELDAATGEYSICSQ
jgi:ABC-type multidrug transport system fused ATPase/permease subunit